MREIPIKDDYIKLQQALQLCGACSSGAEAKYEILNGKVTVNSEEETRRGRKLKAGDVVSYMEKEYMIVSVRI